MERRIADMSLTFLVVLAIVAIPSAFGSSIKGQPLQADGSQADRMEFPHGISGHDEVCQSKRRRRDLTSIYASDPFAPPRDGGDEEVSDRGGQQLSCSDAGISDCDSSCPWTDWWTQPDRTINIDPVQQVTLTSSSILQGCFQLCTASSPPCTAFSSNEESGLCQIFQTFHWSKIKRVKGPALSIRMWPERAIMQNEWIATRNIRPISTATKRVDLSQFPSENPTWVTCLDLCNGGHVNVNSNSNPNPNPSPQNIVAVFELDTNVCSCYDERNTELSIMEPNLVTLTHASVVDPGNFFQFQWIGHSSPYNGPVPAPSSDSDEDSSGSDEDSNSSDPSRSNFDSDFADTLEFETADSCLNACSDAGWDCLVVTTRTTDENTVLCTLHSKIPTQMQYIDGDSSTNSYHHTVQKDQSLLLKLPNYVTVIGQPLFELELGSVDECIGQTLTERMERSWGWLSFDPDSILCAIYPQDIEGLLVSGEGLKGPGQSVLTFRKSIPTTDPDYFAFDDFWAAPEELEASSVKGYPPSLTSSSSLDECLAECVNSDPCAGFYYPTLEADSGSHENSFCTLLYEDDMMAVLNRPVTSPTPGHPLRYTTRVFKKQRDLRFLLDRSSVHSCQHHSDLNDRFSSINRANPFVDEGALAAYRGQLPDGERGPVEPHGVNFMGQDPPLRSPPSKYSDEYRENKSDRSGSAEGQRSSEEDGDRSRSTSRSERDTRLSLNRRTKRASSLLTKLKTFIGLGGTLSLGIATLFGAPVVAAVGAAVLTVAALNQVAIAVCLITKCDDSPNCDIICALAPAKSRFLAALEPPNDSSEAGRARKKRAPQSCTCDDQPVPTPQGTGLAPPDDVNRQLQEDCKGKRVGSVCNICCRVGNEVEKNPTCKCPNNSPLWDPLRPKCKPRSSCSVGKMITSIPGTIGGYHEILRTPIVSCKNELYFGIGFDYSRKTPFYGVYKFTMADASWYQGDTRERRFTTFPCTVNGIAAFQLSDQFYGNENANLPGTIGGGQFDRGHIVPAADMKKTRDNLLASFTYVNSAPQDHSSNLFWGTLESKIRAVLSTPVVAGGAYRGGYIMTGTCFDRTRTAPESYVPICFWKMVCTTATGGATTVAAFYHVNIVSTTDAEKKKRRQEIYTIRNPDLLQALGMWGPSSVADMWAEFAQFYTSAADVAELTKCSNANQISFPDLGLPSTRDLQTTANSTGAEQTDEDDHALYHFWNGNLFGPDFDPDEEPVVEPPPIPQSETGSAPLCDKKVVGYVTAWGDVPFTPKQAGYLTHVIFAFVPMSEDGSLRVGSPEVESSNDFETDERKSYLRLYEIRNAKAEGGGRLKTMFAVGGWDNSQHFSKVIASRRLTNNFIKSALDILDYWGMDGLDITFEYPALGDAGEASPEDKKKYVRFLTKVRAGLEAHAEAKGRSQNPYILTVVGAAGERLLDPGFDLKEIASIVDWINVMTLDYFGPWDSEWGGYTGPIAPLYSGGPEGYSDKLNDDFTLEHYYCQIGDASKIVMGLGFYGRFWNNSGTPVESSNPLWRRAEENSGGAFDGGFESWRNIEAKYLSDTDLTQEFDDTTKTPYLFQSQSAGFLMTYEDPESISLKVKYAASKGLAGIMVWAVDFDDEQNSMLRTASSSTLCSPADSTPYECPRETEYY